MNDPIVDEIRIIRDAHAALFNYDLEAIYRYIKQREKEREEKTGRKFIPAPLRQVEPPTAPPPAAPAEPRNMATEAQCGVRALQLVLRRKPAKHCGAFGEQRGNP